MKVMVTGAGGFVGAAFVARALSVGHDVVAMVRPFGNLQRLTASRVEIVYADMTNTSEVKSVMQQHRPEAIVHAAWSGVSNASRNERSQLTDNMAAILALMDAAAATGVRKFVGIGSQAEYGLISGRIGETALPAPTSLYGATKVAVQVLAGQLCADTGIDFAWLRLFSTYGPCDNPSWLIPSMVEALLDAKRPRTTEGRQLWDYLFIDDVGDAIRAVVESKQAVGVLNLGSGMPVSIRSIIEQVRDIAAPGLPLVFGEIPYKADQIWHMEADIGKLTRLSGFRPKVTLTDGLSRTVAWHASLRNAP